MRISDWSSDVCSSYLLCRQARLPQPARKPSRAVPPAGQRRSLASTHVRISCRQSVVPVADILPPRAGEKKGGPTCGPPMGGDQKKFQLPTSSMYPLDCQSVSSPYYGTFLPGVRQIVVYGSS